MTMASRGEPLETNVCVTDYALRVLLEPNPIKKAELTRQGYELWSSGSMSLPCAHSPRLCELKRPARDEDRIRLVPPSQLPRRGKGGSLSSRQALLHSLVHIECSAIDLAWDIIARFGGHPDYQNVLPIEFFADFVKVAEDEARHFLSLLKRLQDTGMDYGDLPAHDGLWESAASTADSLPARLAVEHCTHEARGLDVLPQTISRFRAGGDKESADLLECVIYKEEISHCAAGVRWLKHLFQVARTQQTPQDLRCQSPVEPPWAVDAQEYDTVAAWFQSLVRKYFHGNLKPPFNTEARAAAGFEATWYLPLAEKVASP
jgi:uncharacterized ferritin-like protein (DUF455 family)